MRRTAPQANSEIFEPIRGRRGKGFMIGWIAIVAVSAVGFGFASASLSYSSADLKVANHEDALAVGPAS